MQLTLAAALALSGLLTIGSSQIQPEEPPIPGVEAMLGTWDVDLRPTPDSDEYLMKLTLSRNDAGELEATFYNGSVASNIVTNALFDRPHVAFLTTDGAGDYHTQLSLLPDGTIEGTTHAVARDFLSVWTGKRAE